jgi:hypothetical protein
MVSRLTRFVSTSLGPFSDLFVACRDTKHERLLGVGIHRLLGQTACFLGAFLPVFGIVCDVRNHYINVRNHYIAAQFASFRAY